MPYVVESTAASVAIEVVAYSGLTAEVVAADATNKIGSILIRVGDSCDAASKVDVFVSAENDVVMKSIYLQAGAASSSTPDVDDEGNILGTPQSNEIFYTSTDGNIVEPYVSSAFGGIIISNTYNNGVGVIVFDRPITTIGNYAFYITRSLTNVTIPDRVTTIGGAAFVDCRSLTSVTIPDSVTTIGEGAFAYCSSLTSVTIGAGLNYLSSRLFAGCTSLTSVVIPDHITSISSSAFEGCSALERVEIGAGIEEIYDYAFRYCYILNDISVKAVTPPAITSLSFGDIGTKPTFRVPNASVDAYKTAEYWSNYAEMIIGCAF